MAKSYASSQTIVLSEKLRQLLDFLPPFSEDYFRGIADTTQIKTRIAYAYDLRIFFYYLTNHSDKFKNKTNEKDFIVDDLDILKPVDIEKYADYLSYYTLPHYKDQNAIVTYTNTQKGKMRKLASLRSFYKYYYKTERIKNNPSVMVDLPKLHDKNITRLDPNEVVELLDNIESGKGLTKDQMKYHNKTYVRDLAIITLLVGTGIRISECVGLNIKDFNFENNSFIVTRKGGDQTILYMPKEVSDSLKSYLNQIRNEQLEYSDQDADAMFLSMQKKRMSVSSMEKMVKKYSKISVPLKNISPHKFRSTYGTNLYRQTQDIYLVADVLGHKDVNTTKRHYAAMEEDRRRAAAQATVIRAEDSFSSAEPKEPVQPE